MDAHVNNPDTQQCGLFVMRKCARLDNSFAFEPAKTQCIFMPESQPVVSLLRLSRYAHFDTRSRIEVPAFLKDSGTLPYLDGVFKQKNPSLRLSIVPNVAVPLPGSNLSSIQKR